LKAVFALVLLLASAPVLAEPVSLTVQFSLETCIEHSDGTGDCTLSGDPAETIQLDNSDTTPGVWTKSMTRDGNDFTADIAVVRNDDGDRLIFRVVSKDHRPAYVTFKLNDWKNLQHFLFEPEPYRSGDLSYQPRLEAVGL
jgi:hypothetical protein